MTKSRVTYLVPYADTDKMGVVYHANYLIYFERARTELMRDQGFSYREMEAAGLQLPIIEAHCNYHKPAFYDDLLHLHGWIGEVTRVRLKVCCEAYRGEELIAQGYTLHACIHAETGKATRLPAVFQKAAECM